MPKRKKTEKTQPKLPLPSRAPKPEVHTPLALCDKLIPNQTRRRQLELICQALDPLPDAISITDPKQDRLLYVNPAWQKLFRYTSAEALYQHARILNLSDESDQLIDDIITVTQTGGWSGRILNQDKHQHIFPVQLRTRRLLDPRQEVIGILSIRTPAHPPALGPEQIQAVIDAQTTALHQTLGQTNNQPQPLGLDSQSSQVPNLKLLSAREREIFVLIGHGLTPAQIAQRLHLSVHTIHAHRANLRAKLDLPDATTLTYWAIHWAGQGGLPQ